jgi:hypothetical protein
VRFSSVFFFAIFLYFLLFVLFFPFLHVPFVAAFLPLPHFPLLSILLRPPAFKRPGAYIPISLLGTLRPSTFFPVLHNGCT